MCLSLATAIPSAGDDDVGIETSPAENLINVENISSEFNEEYHYYVNMTTVYDYLDTIENITRSECSSDVLDVALDSLAQIVVDLSVLSSSD